MPTRRTFLLGALSAVVATACGEAAKRSATSSRPASGVAGTGTTAGATTPSSPQAPGGPAQYVPHGPRGRPAVALTFHGSGDPALTAQMLDLTGRLHVPITVFAVGQWLEQHPDLAGKILGAGHELANHTYTHPTLSRLGQLAVSQEITRCATVLTMQTGGNGRWFRPSGIESQPSQLILDEAGKAGYATVVGFDVDPLDYQDPGANAIVARVAAGIGPGSIVSLHLGHTGTVSAFERVAGSLQSRGLSPVLVRDLLA
jgi:peptidoglycan/xylan/chitin deacetylase (PgdA/CDA1 family)